MGNNKTIDVLVKQFLDYKRNIGYQYLTSERYLNEFTKYMKEKTPEAVLPDKDIILGYLDTKKNKYQAYYTEQQLF